jgi:uncharacterized protein YdhG (YjbR/CyaY superfamily)
MWDGAMDDIIPRCADRDLDRAFGVSFVGARSRSLALGVPTSLVSSTRRAMSKKPSDVAEYLAAMTDEQRATVEQLLATVRAAVPEAEETFSYGLPGFRFAGRPLAWVAAWKRHYSLYPVNVAQVAALAAPGDVYEAEKGTLRIPSDAAVPYGLVTRIVQARAGEIAAGAR